MTLRQQKKHIENYRGIGEKYEGTRDALRVLHTEKRGRVEKKRGEVLDIADVQAQVDVGTKSKAYKLHLENGPFASRYTPSGDAVLYFGNSDVYSVDTVKLVPHCERQIQDKIHDATFLHRHTYFALAQSKAVYVYDRQGVEVHALRTFGEIRKLAFLHDHMLLAALSIRGVLHYQDTTVGKLVSEINTKEWDSALAQDATNGVLYLTGPSGHVSLWSPRSNEYLAKIMCHASKIRHLKVSETGKYLVTSAGHTVSSWDIRNTYAPLSTLSAEGSISALDISQTGMLALSYKNTLKVCNLNGGALMQYRIGRDRIHDLSYTPYEDILTLGTETGVEHVVVPGSGEATYRRNDNPRFSKKEKQNIEVRKMLEKVPADMISLENEIGSENTSSFTEKITEMKGETPANRVRRLMQIHYGKS